MSDLVLALDTTREAGSIALTEGERTVHEVELRAPDGFGEVVFDGIQRLLNDANIKLKDCRMFAAASGPGSFTGVRVGLACVKGLAEALGKPAFGISSLRALAEFGQGEVRVAVIDARRDEVYARAGGAEVVIKFPELLLLLSPGAEFITTDAAGMHALLSGTSFESARVIQAPPAQAAVIGRLAWCRHLAGESGDAARIEPNYVRRADAEMWWTPPG